MANTITRFKNYVPMLDEVYKLASLSSVLDGPADMMREGASAEEIVVPVLSTQGLANYNRGTGYSAGDVTLTHETYKCEYNRGRIFTVDAVDNMETAGVAFGRLAGEFIRTQVAPEIDAYRFSQYALKNGIGAATPADLTSGADVVAALRAGTDAMDNGEVPMTERYLFITPALYGLVEDLDTTKSRAVLARFAQVIQVPQTRFYNSVTLGTNGYTKTSSTGKNLNFLIVHKPAVVQYNKHVAPKVITPEQNQTADAWKFGYRVCGIADVFGQKLAGVYKHEATT